MSTTLLTPTALRLQMSGRLIVEAWTAAYDVSFSGDALGVVHAMIREGVQRLVDAGDDRDAAKVFEAQENLGRFLFQLTRNARDAQYAEIELHHVQDAQSSFCPVYPFT